MLSTRIHLCHGCDRRSPPPYTGVCLCTVNKKNIIDNATTGLCPLNKFRRGPGDWIHVIIKFIGIHAAVQWWARLTKTPCGCDAKRDHINAEWGEFWERAKFRPY